MQIVWFIVGGSFFLCWPVVCDFFSTSKDPVLITKVLSLSKVPISGFSIQVGTLGYPD